MTRHRLIMFTAGGLVLLALLWPWTAPEAQQGRLTRFSTQSAVSCATTSTLALPANVNRSFLGLANISDTAIFLKAGTAAVVGQGLFLASSTAPGSTVFLDQQVPSGALYCIFSGASGTKSMTVIEGLR